MTSNENEDFKRSIRELEKQRKDAVQKYQDECPHLQGSNPLSNRHFKTTSIAWHRFDDYVIRGICTNCLRVFTPEDSDFDYWFTERQGNTISGCAGRELKASKEEFEAEYPKQFLETGQLEESFGDPQTVAAIGLYEYLQRFGRNMKEYIKKAQQRETFDAGGGTLGQKPSVGE